ncbi:UTP--glucose-1-phosphate uridylyltransferase [Candidatus Uhrbacteria bacterium RIFCSPLOWO2_12_FULL_46_10]|uniref:UTP--glucose-1-phosphate uridylyltransferase n=1 Tax=Candidatus Uhrbacteria bacterium RIFCSPLOWO2_01_FULL_47_25 TaxID=1802402 RepID=A0A1F7UXT8_9BACT|nr:MAG: UTP-glucose-1-phosphate uridylyltransferase [Parcubacteria group bacterium GW2011_GWA2_46_9]OGL59750.1 MAG: UTP--glucose-1-phosphate uridylyltransferase [Candidatus Uhrbacteria bacterium RIFCSPHIGHO2_01_FULL_46_23]OGL70546.1 MAG: UTP--glucose-1-phosphate uridylyltransferase [Candidatus Uhrbacteria bacterium RIFCSPHIGHO2_02_FULL_47_29]OGL75802.1 MAG: UTP--glucose-1-phosphate uridylyltransferase [Candidatus Uhrbacteria bacterium RIFCSPHIGHO2_12_FULL_46_13]OGL83079.1 MAG: UTP--glucose-1-ph
MTKVTTAVIPAAGFGTRFLPATKAQPKEMLTVVDKPVIQYVVEEAVAAGITDIIIITGQSKRAIEDHFDRNFELEALLREKKKKNALKEVKNISNLANFIYIRQKEQLGDGHAVLEAKSLLRGRPFAVLSGDDIIEGSELKEMITTYNEFSAPVVAVTRVPKLNVQRYGIIDGIKIRHNLYQLTKVVEKPSVKKAPSNLAIIFRYIVTPEFLTVLERTPRRHGHELRMADAMARYITYHPAYGYLTTGTWHDCGSKLGLLKASVTYGLKHSEIKRDFKNYLKTLS